MGKSERNITNWKQYNQALVNRGSVTFWLDEAAVNAWHCTKHHGGRGRGFQFSDTAIETALMLKGIFKLSLRATEGFINSLFQLMKIPLIAPDYSCISKRAKTVNVKYRNPSRGAVAHVVVDATTHEIIGAQTSLETVADNEVLPALLIRAEIKEPTQLVGKVPKQLSGPFDGDKPALKVTLALHQHLPLAIEGVPVEVSFDHF